MAPVSKITREKFRKKDNYRLQVNCDQRLVAYLYYAMAEYYPKATVERMRNEYSKPAVETFRAKVAALIKTDKAFAAYINTYLARKVEPILQDEARELYRELGWDDDKGRLL